MLAFTRGRPMPSPRFENVKVNLPDSEMVQMMKIMFSNISGTQRLSCFGKILDEQERSCCVVLCFGAARDRVQERRQPADEPALQIPQIASQPCHSVKPDWKIQPSAKKELPSVYPTPGRACSTPQPKRSNGVRPGEWEGGASHSKECAAEVERKKSS